MWPGQWPLALTLLGHAHFEALLQPAVLAAVAGHLVDDAVLVPVTRVHHVLLDAAAEEALGVEEKESGQPHPACDRGPGHCCPQAFDHHLPEQARQYENGPPTRIPPEPQYLPLYRR